MDVVCCCCCCPCAFKHYRDVQEPAFGQDIISSHDASKFTLLGDAMPLVEVKIPPQQTMIGEPGALSYFENGITMESLFHDGSSLEEPGCIHKTRMCGRRCCSGENATVMHFQNTSDKERTIAFGNELPGHIIAVDLGTVPNNTLFTNEGSFIFGPRGTRIDVARMDCMQCCCGAGWLMQKLVGNGTVFLGGGGTIIKQSLKGETHRIDPSSLVAFTSGLNINVQRAGGCCTMCCGGEGLAFTTISGTGDYWVSSSPISDQIAYAVAHLPPKKS